MADIMYGATIIDNTHVTNMPVTTITVTITTPRSTATAKNAMVGMTNKSPQLGALFN
jgi:hypothetical protein